jgi:hypothetical protein
VVVGVECWNCGGKLPTSPAGLEGSITSSFYSQNSLQLGQFCSKLNQTKIFAKYEVFKKHYVSTIEKKFLFGFLAVKSDLAKWSDKIRFNSVNLASNCIEQSCFAKYGVFKIIKFRPVKKILFCFLQVKIDSLDIISKQRVTFLCLVLSSHAHARRRRSPDWTNQNIIFFRIVFFHYNSRI